MDRNELFALMNAANYLGVSPLSRSSAAFVAEKLQTMSVGFVVFVRSSVLLFRLVFSSQFYLFFSFGVLKALSLF